MANASKPVVFVWPGDLHLEDAGRENYRVAQWMIDEVNALVRPDFVQFAGDNVQQATAEQFEMFLGLCRRLQVPWQPLVGDHDVHHDAGAHAYRARLGDTYGAWSLRGFRFIRLNTMQFRPLGMTREQTLWFRYEVDLALTRGERVVVFQHHYPYQIWETFDGPGIDDWREVVQTRRITAIFAGHTHYGQTANDGRNVMFASRSIGEPEGGAAGYSVVYLDGDDLAVKYRTNEESGPIAIITHPRDMLLATDPRHIVSGLDEIRVRTWSASAIERVRGRVAGGEWFELAQTGGHDWSGPLPGDRLNKGENRIEVEAIAADGTSATDAVGCMVDRSARFTAVPMVRPMVTATKFC